VAGHQAQVDEGGRGKEDGDQPPPAVGSGPGRQPVQPAERQGQEEKGGRADEVVLGDPVEEAGAGVKLDHRGLSLDCRCETVLRPG